MGEPTGAAAIRRKQKCDYCSLPHHAVRPRDQKWICAPCDYLDLVRRDSTDLREAITYLRRHQLCAYCGESATDVEHVVPRSTRLPTFTLPACSECNGVASARVFSCFEDKKAYIQERIRRRYAKYLRIPEWDEEELAEMGPKLRRNIRIAQEARQQTEQRIRWHWLEAVLAKTGDAIVGPDGHVIPT